jgi:hypothetical protein
VHTSVTKVTRGFSASRDEQISTKLGRFIEINFSKRVSFEFEYCVDALTQVDYYYYYYYYYYHHH